MCNLALVESCSSLTTETCWPGCLQARAFGASVAGRGECKSRAHFRRLFVIGYVSCVVVVMTSSWFVPGFSWPFRCQIAESQSQGFQIAIRPGDLKSQSAPRNRSRITSKSVELKSQRFQIAAISLHWRVGFEITSDLGI